MRIGSNSGRSNTGAFSDIGSTKDGSILEGIHAGRTNTGASSDMDSMADGHRLKGLPCHHDSPRHTGCSTPGALSSIASRSRSQRRSTNKSISGSHSSKTKDGLFFKAIMPHLSVTSSASSVNKLRQRSEAEDDDRLAADLHWPSDGAFSEGKPLPSREQTLPGQMWDADIDGERSVDVRSFQLASDDSMPAMDPMLSLPPLQTYMSPFTASIRLSHPHRQFVPVVAHGLTLVILAASDIACLIEHWHDWQRLDVLCLGVALGLLYTSLMAWLVMVLVPCGSSGHSQRHTNLLYLLLAVLHTGAAFVSAWWRQALRGSCHAGVRAAYVASTLQLAVTVLFATSGFSVVAFSLASFLAFVVLEVLQSAPWTTIVDDTLPLACVLIACMLANNCGSLPRFASPLARARREPYNQMRGIFKSILTDQFHSNRPRSLETCWDQLVSRLEGAKGAAHQSNLDPDLRDLLGSVFSYIIDELAHLSSLDEHSIRELQKSPPMTVEFVQRTLSQVVKEDLPMLQRLSTPRSSARTSHRSWTAFDPSRATTPRASSSKVKPTMHGKEATQEDASLTGPVSNSEGAIPARAPAQVPELEMPAGDGDQICPSSGEGRQQAFNRGLHEMMAELCFEPSGDLPPRPAELSEELDRALDRWLGTWHFNVFELNRLTDERPLVAVGTRALASLVQELDLESSQVLHFLDSVERSYSCNPYHSSMHGVDVMNSMVYFWGLMQRDGVAFDPVEHLAALVAAGSHDVGHRGLSNGFQVAAQTPLSRLYNDQSCLENMHACITFTILTLDHSNFLRDLPAPMPATFRSWVTLMILGTDLSKHLQSVSRFKQEFSAHRDPTAAMKPAERRELAVFALKCCDVAHSTKPFGQHALWTLRINDEFFRQGDMERQLGLACSPFCDRTVTCVAESQRGFFSYIVAPLYAAISEYLGVGALSVEVVPMMETNRDFWKQYKGEDFDYADPMSNAGMLRLCFQEIT